jgi:sodium/bile acid cotransporter 7
VAGAVFNATLSSVIGVVLTPLWVGAVMKTTGQPLPVGPVMLDLVRWLVLPLVAGQLCRRWLGAFAQRHKTCINVVDRGTILLLVYTSFCDSFRQGVWSGNGALTLLVVLAGTGAILAVALLGTSQLARAFHFDRGDRIAAVFCGSKKTLASGVPMAKLIFGASPALGLILLPIMVYHPLQLVVGGFLARRWAQEP